MKFAHDNGAFVTVNSIGATQTDALSELEFIQTFPGVAFAGGELHPRLSYFAPLALCCEG